MTFAARDLLALVVFAALVTFIFLDKYLIGGTDQYIVSLFNNAVDFFKGL